jgi:hypothetical protein
MWSLRPPAAAGGRRAAAAAARRAAPAPAPAPAPRRRPRLVAARAIESYMVDKLRAAEATFKELQMRMADPDVAANSGEFQKARGWRRAAGRAAGGRPGLGRSAGHGPRSRRRRARGSGGRSDARLGLRPSTRLAPPAWKRPAAGGRRHRWPRRRRTWRPPSRRTAPTRRAPKRRACPACGPTPRTRARRRARCLSLEPAPARRLPARLRSSSPRPRLPALRPLAPPPAAAARQDAERQLASAQRYLRDEASSDPDLAEFAREEISDLESQISDLEAALRLLLLPTDPLDAKDIMLEIRAGAGGDEAGIWAGDLLRMYQRYAQAQARAGGGGLLGAPCRGERDAVCSRRGRRRGGVDAGRPRWRRWLRRSGVV